MSEREEIDVALQQLIQAVGSQAGAARALGVHRSHVTRLLRGEVEFGPKIAKRLGFRRVVSYERTKIAWPRTSAHCLAGSDGECNWPRCPQIRDGEPGKTGRHCPIDMGRVPS